MDDHPTRRRLRNALAATILALAVAPASAGAATVNVAWGTLFYTAGSGEANVLTIVPQGSGLKVTDSGRAGSAPVSLSVGSGCTAAGTGQALCSGASLLAIATGDLNDYVDTTRVGLNTGVDGGSGNDQLYTGPAVDGLSGGDGNDVLDGGAGRDGYLGGNGDDAISAVDGGVDDVGCGGGTDSGAADSVDNVAGDCEAVGPPTGGAGAPTLPGRPAGTEQSGTATTGIGLTGHGHGSTRTGANDVADPDAAIVPPQTLTVDAHGTALVQVLCPPTSSGCTGTVTIEADASALARAAVAGHGAAIVEARRRKVVQLGKARFHAKPGQKIVVPVKLARRGRWRVLRRKGKGVRCRVTVTTRTGAGKPTTTRQQTTLMLRREAGHGKKR